MQPVLRETSEDIFESIDRNQTGWGQPVFFIIIIILLFIFYYFKSEIETEYYNRLSLVYFPDKGRSLKVD